MNVAGSFLLGVHGLFKGAPASVFVNTVWLGNGVCVVAALWQAGRR
jgi:hypothetical protein